MTTVETNGKSGLRHVLDALAQIIWWRVWPWLPNGSVSAGFNPRVDAVRLESIRAKAARGQRVHTLHDVRFLLGQLSELQQRAAFVRDIHAPVTEGTWWVCVECGEVVEYDGTCRTVRTLDGAA